MAENLNNTEPRATFDRTADVNTTAEQLSYICKYCGKVNAISAPNCIRCGKRRPRNEYLDAMKKLEASKTVREEFISEQIKAEAELKDARQQQFVRMVESRVEEERAQILAQQEVKLDQDREDIKRATARDAVLRIIAAENAAEARVAEAEARADAVITGRSKEIDDLIASEREKALNAAAEKLVAERAAIEEVARERVEANRKASEFDSNKQIAAAQDEARRAAAKEATVRIIAAEKAAEDQIRLSRDAFQRAATERIIEERILADKEASARFAAERMAIERAAEERIRAERESVARILDQRGAAYQQPAYQPYYQPQPQVQQVQPFAIVPYLNQNQPVYQYNPNRVVYRFVPDEVQAQPVESRVEQIQRIEAPVEKEGKKAKKEKKVKVAGEKTVKARVCGIFTLLLSVLALVALVIGQFVPDMMLFNITDDTLLEGNNIEVILAGGAFVLDGANSLLGAGIVPPAFLTDSPFYASAGAIGFPAVALVSVALAVFAIVAAIVLIRSIIRIIGGKGKKADWVAGLVMIIATVVGIVCTFLSVMLGAEYELMEALQLTLLGGFGYVVFLAVSLLITIFAAIGGSKKKEKAVTNEAE